MIKRAILIVALIIASISCNGSLLKFSAHDILPRKGFVLVKKAVDIHACKGKECFQETYTGIGSGFVVKTTYKGSYVMTAAHVCLASSKFLNDPQYKVKTKLKVKTLSGRQFDARIIDYNSKIDACMMFVQDLVSDVETVKVAEEGPKEGDKVFNIASPYGIHDYNIVPLFEGRFAGRDQYDDMYVFPAAPGSSGSMILNEKGELIGLLHSVYVRMQVVILSVRYDNLKQFINRNLIESAQEKYPRKSSTMHSKL